MGNNSSRIKGFTIIEVVLVLGVAGLIFLIAFLVVPTLQRNARDTKRREDLIEFATALKKYQTNNRGAFPPVDDDNYGGSVVVGESLYTNPRIKANSWPGFYRDYLPHPFKDPSGNNYGLFFAKCSATAAGGNCAGTAAFNTINSMNTSTTMSYTINVILQASCKNGTVVGSSNDRNAVVLYKLEGGGFYCGDV